MRRSLIWQIAIPFVLIILLTIGGFALYFSNFLKNTYLTSLEQNLKTQASLLSKPVAPIIESGYPYEGLQQLVADFSATTHTRVTVILLQGIVIGDSSSDPTTMENHLDRPEIQQALTTGLGIDTRFSDTLLTSFLYLAIPVQTNGKIIGFVRLADSLTQIDSEIANLRRAVGGIAAISGTLVILLAFLVANRTLSPLRRLAKAVGKLGEGEASLNLPMWRKDEIGLLSKSFGEMAVRFNDQVDDFKEERGKLTAVLRHMTDGALLVNSDGKVTLVNPAAERIFNINAAGALGKTLVEVVRLHQFVDLWKSSFSSGRQELITLETTPDRLFIQCIATPLAESLPGSTLLVFEDLTSIHKLEVVRRDFVSNVSHELRTPLASLKAVSETLQGGALADPPAAQRFLAQMEKEIDDMTQLVTELLELSRIESGQTPFNLQSVDPRQLLVRSVERMELQAERAGLKISIDCLEGMPSVRADRERIEQVLMNLLHNAVKFTPAGGEITASARPDGGWILFSVKDNGVGIAPEALPRIFERFYKADQSRSGGGTGLGLSIARHTIEAHGGRIWVESEPGVGSTFTFTLPLA